jgi:hypothetical protein
VGTKRGTKGRSLRIVYDFDGWAFHNRARALEKYRPADFEVTITPIRGMPSLEAAVGDEPMDVLFLMARFELRRVRALLDERGWSSWLVVNWSNGWPMRLPLFHHCLALGDLVLINNRGYWEMAGKLPGTRYLPNGVDREIFNIARPIAARRPRVLWVGSKKRRELKGYDDYLLPLRSRLTASGIDCDFRLVDPHGDRVLSPEEMAEWYNTGTVLICASEMEGTPNPALEAAACGCTIVSTAVGNMPDLIRNGVNGYIVERDVDALMRGVEAAIRNYRQLAERMQHDIAKWDWCRRSADYYELLREVCDPAVHEQRSFKTVPVGPPPRRSGGPDAAGKPSIGSAAAVPSTGFGELIVKLDRTVL